MCLSRHSNCLFFTVILMSTSRKIKSLTKENVTLKQDSGMCSIFDLGSHFKAKLQKAITANQ